MSDVGAEARRYNHSRVSSIGRNNPCSCGSGRKFKHCCLATADAAQSTRRRMRDAEGRLIPLLWTIALEHWRQDGLDEAYDSFFADTPCPEDILQHREHESLFLTWLGLRFAPATDRGPRILSAAAAALAGTADDAKAGLSTFEQRFLAAAEAASPSFHLVAAAAPGEWMDLEDVMTGSTCRVLESTASRTIRRGEVIYARVVTLDGVSIMVGCGSTALPPMRRADLADLRRSLSGRRARLDPEGLRLHEDLLRRWYLLAADQAHNPPLPKLQNTDGDPLEPTTLTFTLSCTPAEAFAALRPLNINHSDAEILSDAELDTGGSIRTFSIDWTKRGNRRHAAWDNTILGHLEVDGRTLTGNVNSRRRATRLRREIEKRMVGRVRLDKTEILSVESMVEQARESARAGDALPEPELPAEAAAMLQYQDEHWASWLDQDIPALGGLTPHEAARSAAGRERLEALLADFELSGGAPVGRLRAALKL